MKTEVSAAWDQRTAGKGKQRALVAIQRQDCWGIEL